MVEYARLVSYSLGMVFGFILFGQMLRLRFWLAKLLAIAMLGWALNCIVLLMVLLTFMITGDSRPSWFDMPFNINALLLGLIPVLLYVGLLRRNGNE